MKPYLLISVCTFAVSSALADSITNAERLLCATSRVVACFEGGECIDVLPWELNIPQFVVIDTKKKTISTTKASNENRSTPIRTLQRDGGAIIFQGIEKGRSFGVVIDEESGLLTGSVARDGVAVSVFGACTDADARN